MLINFNEIKRSQALAKADYMQAVLRHVSS